MSSENRRHATGSMWGESRSWGERARRFVPVLVQSVKDTLTDHGPQWAAAVAYYALLSAFPLLLAAASVAAYVVDPAWAVERITATLGEFVPRGEGRVERIVDQAIAARGTAGLLSLATLLWSGTRVFGSLTQALNIAFDADESYGFFTRILVEIVMLLTLGVVLIVALSSTFLIGLLSDALAVLPSRGDLVLRLVQGALQTLLMVVAFFLIYQFVPRGRQDRRASATGSIVATLLFLLARPLFLFYVERFGSYNRIYGSLGIVIILLVWIWVVALIAFFGGEVAAHTRAQLIEGRSAVEIGRRHADRGGR